jgi:hypothetical protein
MGHYAVRKDLQDVFTLNAAGALVLRESNRGSGTYRIMEHFGITGEEVTELFGGQGCGNARTREQAAAYLEMFAERKWPTKLEEPEHEEPEAVVEVAKVEVREAVCV